MTMINQNVYSYNWGNPSPVELNSDGTIDFDTDGLDGMLEDYRSQKEEEAAETPFFGEADYLDPRKIQVDEVDG